MPTVFSPPSVSALKTRTPRYVFGSRAASVDGAAALIFAVAMLAFTLPLIFVFILAFTVVVPRPHPLIAKTIIEIARTKIGTGGLTSVCFMFTFSAGNRAFAATLTTRGRRGKDHRIT